MQSFKETDVFIGRRLRKVRQERGLTQSDIGKILSVTFQQVQKYELGHNRLSCASAIELSNALGFNVTDIFPLPCPTPSRRKKTKKISEHEAPIEVHLHYGRLL